MRIHALSPIVLFLASAVAAQQASPVQSSTPRDAVLDIASNTIGRALFLRCFCADNNLAFDADGRVLKEQTKTVDWTLDGVNVLKVERKSPTEIELDGVRAAIRYAPDRNEFDRHPLNSDQDMQKMKILISTSGPGNDPKAFKQTLAAVFATGIDMPLQQSMPAYWQHYFNPKMAWPKDDLTGQSILDPGHPSASITHTNMLHKIEPTYTSEASADHVQGLVRLRAIVDSEGLLRRVSIAQPIGYGLDQKAIEAAQKAKYSPATISGKPIAEYLQLDENFLVVPAYHTP